MTETNRLSPAERYCRDIQFAHLVDMIEAMIERADYTPTELREAVILAAIRQAERRPAEPIRIAVADRVFVEVVPTGPDQ
jgi:hypothetical protein